MLEALFGLCRKAVENEPLKIFMALSDVERNRTKPLEPAPWTGWRASIATLSAQYPLFSEAPALTDKTILAFLDTAHAINQIRDPGTARRRGGHHAGADRAVADLRAPGSIPRSRVGRDAGGDPGAVRARSRTNATSSTAAAPAYDVC